MFDVVACGFEPAPLPWLTLDAPAITLPSAGDEDFVERAYDALHDHDRDQRVLVVHPARTGDTRRVRVLRALLQSSGVTPVPLLLPLSGLSATVSWLAALAQQEVTAGVALAGLDRLTAHLPCYAVTTSVARVDLPQVRLGHHLTSWLPGTTVGVAFESPVRVQVGQPTRGVPAPDGPTDLVCSGDPGLAGKLAQTLPPEVRHRMTLDPPAAGALWWGRSRSYEHCLVPDDVAAFAASLLGRDDVRRCPHCGDAMTSACPFCRARESVPA